MLRRTLLVTLVVTLAAAACAGGDDPPGLATDPDPQAAIASCVARDVAGTKTGLRAQSQCVVAGRYTAELTTLTTARGRYAYTSTWGRRTGAACSIDNCGNVVYVWSLGASPALVDSLVVNPTSNTTTTGDVQVSDDGALLVVATEPTGYLVVYSLADPAHPALLSRWTTANVANGVHTAQLSRVGGKLYAFCAIDPRNGARTRLTIVDLSTPASPREVWSREMGNPYVHDVYVRDGYLLTAVWNDGMTVWDVGARRGSPSAPDSIGNVHTATGQIHNILWQRDATTGARFAFLGEEGPGSVGVSSVGDIHVIDMSDLSKPREVAYYTVADAGVHNFSIDETNGILYAAYYNAGVAALDVRGDLASCTAAQQGTLGRCDLAKMGRELGRGLTSTGSRVYVWGVEYANGSLYASDMLGGLWTLTAASR